jgi:transposase
MLASGKAAARKLNPARILLYTDQDIAGLRRTDQQIADTLVVGLRTVARVRQRFVEEGLTAALQPRPRPHGAYRLGEQATAHIIEVAKGEPPQGRKRWTLRLIADRLVVLGYGAFSHETVRQVLKNAVIPWQEKTWCIPPTADAAFVARMEDLLELYQLGAWHDGWRSTTPPNTAVGSTWRKRS